MALQDLFKNMIFVCLGMQEMLKDFFNALAKRGRMSESETAKIINQFMSKSKEARESFKKSLKETAQRTLERMNLPTKDEVESLKSLIKEMNSRLAKIEEKLKE